ncbi:MAG TPA: NYN domain-containing protein [Conexibacter sp.]
MDGFNLYFGARSVCGRGTRGWRWLDLRALSERLLHPDWIDRGAHVDRVVYCTARVSGVEDRSSPADQEVYLRALRAHGSVDRIAFGTFVTRAKLAPLAERDERGRPRLARARWPIQTRDACGADVPGATFMVFYLAREEKGTDVNLATHLLVDVLGRAVEAAVVISNDSDLELPIRVARERVPVGVVNPGAGRPAGKLRGQPFDGVGGHWWQRIQEEAYRAHQLPQRVGVLCRPPGW